MSTRIINIEEQLNDAPVSALQKLVVGLCFLMAMCDGFDTLSIAYVGPVLSEDLGIAPDLLGYVFSSALVGILVGSLIFSVLGDRIGRRIVLIGATVAVGVFALCTALASSGTELLIYRFFTGVGLGATMPNLYALTSDYAPKRHRAIMMTMMFIGWSSGGFLGAFLSNWLIAQYGWTAIFIFGGVTPILLAVLLWYTLPESIGFLAIKPGGAEKAGRLLEKINPNYQWQPDDQFITTDQSTQEDTRPDSSEAPPSPTDLLAKSYRLATTLFWTLFFLNLMTAYSIINWMPTLLVKEGIALSDAIFLSAFSEGGGLIGGILLARAVDRFGPNKGLCVIFIVGACMLISLATVDKIFMLILAISTMIGFSITGGQHNLNALVGIYYPPRIKAMGVGYALAFGRLGAILGPILIGYLFNYGFGLKGVFIAIAMIPLATAILSWFLINHIRQSASSSES